MLLHPHFFCADDERLAAAKRQSAFSSVRLAAYMLPHLLFFCAAVERLRLDCFYTCTFTPGLRPFLTASAPARVQFLVER